MASFRLILKKVITHHERHTQRTLIAEQFGYRLWSADFLPQFAQQAAQIVRHGFTPGFRGRVTC